MEYVKKDIHCPECGEKVATYDGRSTINVMARCKTCRKRIIYNVETKEVIRQSIPRNVASSGQMFF